MKSIYYHGNIELWIGDHLPDNEIICFYHNNAMDGPALLFSNIGGDANKHSLLLPEEFLTFDHPEIVSTHEVENYVTLLRLS